MADPDDEPWMLRRDYRGYWNLPPTLPPTRWPRLLLVMVVGVIAYALVFVSAD